MHVGVCSISSLQKGPCARRSHTLKHVGTLQVGDHGGVVIMAQHATTAPAEEVYFTLDQGDCWHTVLLQEAINIQNIRCARPHSVCAPGPHLEAPCPAALRWQPPADAWTGRCVVLTLILLMSVRGHSHGCFGHCKPLLRAMLSQCHGAHTTLTGSTLRPAGWSPRGTATPS